MLEDRLRLPKQEIAESDAQGDAVAAALKIVGVLTLALIVLAGGLYFFRDRLPDGLLTFVSLDPDDGYVSPLDATCGAGWEEGLPNDRQLKCYMTTNPRRLCDPREKRHFIRIFARYESDYAAWNRALMAGVVGATGKVWGNSMQLGLEGAKLTSELRKKNPDMREVDKLGGSIDGMTKPMRDVTARRAKNLIPRGEMVKNMAVLLSSGYVAVDDFEGWDPPPMVEEAADGLGSVPSPCAPSD